MPRVKTLCKMSIDKMCGRWYNGKTGRDERARPAKTKERWGKSPPFYSSITKQQFNFLTGIFSKSYLSYTSPSQSLTK